jgi:hypothetical protein
MLFRLHETVIFIKLLNFYVMAKNSSGFIGAIGPVTGFMRNGHNFLRSSNFSLLRLVNF